jgi:hypothetical protein
MALDPVRNFAKVTVSQGYNSNATQITLVTGDGAKLPDPTTEGAFNLVWYNDTDYKDPADDPYVEIVRVTAKSGDTLTIQRGQEGTSAQNHNLSGKTYKMVLAMTKKMKDDIESKLPESILTTQGDILIRGATGVERLPPGTAGYFLKTQGSGANPVWASPVVQNIIKSFVAGFGIQKGEAVYIGSDGKVYPTDASDNTKIGFIGFAVNNIQYNNSGDIILKGIADLFSGLTIASDYYLQNRTESQDQANTSGQSYGAYSINTEVWQTFIPSKKVLTKITVRLWAATTSGSYSVTLKIYDNLGNLIASQTQILYLTAGTSSDFNFTFPRIFLNPGQTYKIALVSPSTEPQWIYFYPNPYANGYFQPNTNWDAYFITYYDNAGAIGTSPGTNSVKVGKAISNTEILLP